MTQMSEPFEVNDRVSFRQSDSQFRSHGTIIEVIDNRDEYLDSMGTEYSRYLYVIRDDRHGWCHRLGTTKQAGSVCKEPSRPKTSNEPWDGKF